MNVQSFPVAYTNTTAKKVITLRATALKPVRVKGFFITTTAFNGTSPTLSLGTDATPTEWLNAITPAAVGAAPAVASTAERIITADTDVYIKAGGGGSNTTGAGYLVLETSEMNVDATQT